MRWQLVCGPQWGEEFWVFMVVCLLVWLDVAFFLGGVVRWRLKKELGTSLGLLFAVGEGSEGRGQARHIGSQMGAEVA
jgi:hypothetical protein